MHNGADKIIHCSDTSLFRDKARLETQRDNSSRCAPFSSKVTSTAILAHVFHAPSHSTFGWYHDSAVNWELMESIPLWKLAAGFTALLSLSVDNKYCCDFSPSRTGWNGTNSLSYHGSGRLLKNCRHLLQILCMLRLAFSHPRNYRRQAQSLDDVGKSHRTDFRYLERPTLVSLACRAVFCSQEWKLFLEQIHMAQALRKCRNTS